jgi:cytochrome P450
MGHYGSLVQPSSHVHIFKSHSCPSGISALWGPGLKVCASILKAEHVRLILRHTPSRDFSNFIVRHGRKTLGRDSLILIEGGNKWKSTRLVVQKAFTIGAIQNGRGAVGDCAVCMVRWLMKMAEATKKKNDDDASSCSNGCGGHKSIMDTETGMRRHMVCLDVENFFKLFSLDVFGRVTMDYDFECLKKATTTSTNNNNSSSNNNNNSKENKKKTTTITTCTCFTSPPEAAAFEYLERDIGVRAHPKHLINPFTQFYWMPTKHNRVYRENLNLVNSLMEGVIGLKLNEFLLRVKQEKKQRQKLLQEEEEDEAVEERDEKNHQQQDNDGGSGGDDDEVEDNMITMMLRSVIEQYYRQPKQEQKKQQQQQHPHLNSSIASNSNNTTSSSSCPFSSTTSTTATSSSSSSRHFSSSFQELIPDIDIIPQTMTQSDRTQIITNVTQILHTLLVAGYETTAISLSYTMYCLSKHPRCQDRACEEARRVLVTLDANTKFDEDALPYCKAIITESLRMHVPVIFTTRVSSKNLVLDTDDEGGMVTIPKDTRFIVNPTMIHMDERNFERAEEFLPERWVRWENGGWVDRDFEKEKSAATATGACAVTATPPPSLSGKYTKENAHADTISAANPQNFFAFSDGARNCIGRRLAMMESTIFVAVLFRDMCVDLAEKGYELVKERRFVILAPKNLTIAFWKRDG